MKIIGLGHGNFIVFCLGSFLSALRVQFLIAIAIFVLCSVVVFSVI